MISKDTNSLEDLKINIISWYDFKNTDSILLIGDIDKIIVEFLCKKFSRVVVIENDANKINNLYEISEQCQNLSIIDELFFDIDKFSEKFDYIFIMNYFDKNQTDDEIRSLIDEKDKVLNENGKILAVFKNKLSAKEILNRKFDGFSKERISNIIDYSEFKYNKFYYVLPNENYVNIIFSDNYLPTENDMGRNINFSSKSSNIGTLENEFFNRVIKNYKKDFKNCSNIFFVELSAEEIENEVKAVFYSNLRNDEYKIRTKLLKDIAIKESASEKSIEHIEKIKKNIDILKRFKINTLDNYEESCITSKLAINYEKLDDIFLRFYKSGDSKYKNIINKLKNEILLKLEKTDSQNNIFEKYEIEVPKNLIENMTFIKYGLWDLTLRNVFLINNELYVYDQEWLEENVPIEFIIFRSIWYLEDLTRDEKNDLCKQLELIEYIEIFCDLEEKIGKKITNQNLLRLYRNSFSEMNSNILQEENRLLKENEFQNELMNCKQLVNSDLEARHRIVVSQKENLVQELARRDARINELQIAIANSKSLKCTRTLKKLVKNSAVLAVKIFRKPVKFVCKKALPKKIRRKIKLKAEYSRKLSRLSGIPMLSQYNHTMRIYDRKENTYTNVYSQFNFNKTIGIHLHLYYEDLAQEFYEYLSNIPYVFDLYISIRQGVRPSKIRKVFKNITNLNYLEVVVSENSGRDFGPMFVLFAKKLRKYDYIMHIHSKKSLRIGEEQSAWRRYLLDNLLGTPELITKYFYMMENLDIGLAYPDAHSSLTSWLHTWLDEKELAKKVMKDINIEFEDKILEFSAGSMFWAKTDAIKQLLDLNLTWEDFGKDKKQTGGTLEYVFERIFGVVARHNNYNIAIYNQEKQFFYLNKGDKLFDKYFEQNADIAVNILANYEIISFDIFDTLVTRKIYNPDDVFLLIEKYLKEKNINIDNYKKIRKDAELNVRKRKNFQGDCTIHEIYDEFKNLTDLSEEQILAIKEIEIDTELKLCIPRKDALYIFNKLLNMNKKIILISDMYLTKDMIEKILRNCGYNGYTDILISSEIGYRKDNGTMWDYFFSKYGNRLTVHVGDNEQSDLHQLADRVKLHFYFISSKRLLQVSNYEILNDKFDLPNSVLFGCVYNKVMFNSPFALYDNEHKALIKNPFDLGYAIIGPVILYYMLWLINSLKNNVNNEVILFAAREGYYLQKIYNYLKEKLEIEDLENIEEYYLLISRRAITVAGIENKEDIYNLFRRNYSGTLRECLYYRIGYTELNFENRIIELPRDFDIVKRVIDDNYDIIMNQVKMEKENYLRYINSLSSSIYSKNLNFVDLGYTGTAQYYLSKLLNKKITGKYFALSDKILPLEIGCKVDSCYNDDIHDPNILEGTIYRYALLLEGFLTAPVGQLKYIDENLKPHYTYDDNKDRIKILDEIYRGITELIDDMISIYGKDLLDVKFNRDVIENNYKVFAKETGKLNSEMKRVFEIDDYYSCNGVINGADIYN